MEETVDDSDRDIQEESEDNVKESKDEALLELAVVQSPDENLAETVVEPFCEQDQEEPGIEPGMEPEIKPEMEPEKEPNAEAKLESESAEMNTPENHAELGDVRLENFNETEKVESKVVEESEETDRSGMVESEQDVGMSNNEHI